MEKIYTYNDKHKNKIYFNALSRYRKSQWIQRKEGDDRYIKIVTITTEITKVSKV
jgi:hypothetical protein